MTGVIRDTDHGMQGLLARLAQKKRVRVGLLADQPKQVAEGETVTLSLLEIAAVHEFGAPEAHIPKRSWLRAGVDAAASEIAAVRAKLIPRVVRGELTLDQALNQLGAFVAGKLQARISAGIQPPNAPATVKAKGSDVPLIDTGQLRSSITWIVEDA